MLHCALYSDWHRSYVSVIIDTRGDDALGENAEGCVSCSVQTGIIHLSA